MPARSHTVFLAGPVTGCNEMQKRRWRDELKAKAGRDFRILDPMDDPLKSTSVHELVDKDLKSIQSADAVLAYMWKESIGTAIGIVLARTTGRIVVVVDPNHLENPLLAFYADIVTHTLNEGWRAVKDLLKSSRLMVLKHGGRLEPFDRQKLVESLRGAARGAHKNDIAVPAMVLRRVTEALASSDRKVRGQITTTEIERQMLETLEELEADKYQSATVAGVRDEWLRQVRGKPRRAGPPLPGPSPPAGGRTRVHVHCGKSHTSIWGKHIRAARDIPAEPRRLLEEIAAAGRIPEIKLNTMDAGPKAAAVGIHLDEPRQDGWLYGYLIDPQGVKGRKQSFVLKVMQEGGERDAFEAARARLVTLGAWVA